MQKWYIFQANQVCGPFLKQDLEKMSEAGEIQPESWILRESQTDWTKASQDQDLQFIFQKKTALNQVQEDWVERWVLLRWNVATQSYQQFGPFPTRDILSKVYLGEATYDDYVWRDGFQEWKRIGSVDEFQPSLAVNEKNPNSRPDTKILSPEEALASIVYQEQDASFFEEVPAEALPIQKIELAPEEATVTTSAAIKIQDAFTFHVEKMPTRAAQEKSLPKRFEDPISKKRKWWLFSFIGLSLTIALASFGKSYFQKPEMTFMERSAYYRK